MQDWQSYLIQLKRCAACYYAYLLTKDFTATDSQTINNTKYTKFGPLYNQIRKKSKPAQAGFLRGLRCQIKFNKVQQAWLLLAGRITTSSEN